MKLINKFSGNVVRATQWRVQPEDNNLCLLNKARLVAKVLKMPVERLKVELDTKRLLVMDSATDSHANDTDFILHDMEGNIFIKNVDDMNNNYEFYGR